MTHPEQQPGQPDTTHYFNQIFDYAGQAGPQERQSLRDYIRLEPGLEQQLQAYLREGYDEAWAMGMLGEALQPPDRDTPHPFDIVRDAGHEHIMRRTPAFAATGIRLDANIAGNMRIGSNPDGYALYVDDISAFSAAVRGCRTPDTPAAQQQATKILNHVVLDMLLRVSLGVERENPGVYETVYNSDWGKFAPVYDKYDPGRPFLTNLAQEIAPQGGTTLQQELLRLGVDPQHTTALEHLHTAGDDPLLRGAWAAAVNLGIYDRGNIGDRRLINTYEWDIAINLLEYLNRVAPDADYTKQLGQKIVGDIDAELDRPFDPASDDGRRWSIGTIIRHDSVEDMLEKLHEDEINMIFEPPQLAELNDSEEVQRRMRQEHRQHVVALLREARRKVLDTIPPDQWPRPKPLPRRPRRPSGDTQTTSEEGAAETASTDPDTEPTIFFIKRLIDTMRVDGSDTPSAQQPPASKEEPGEGEAGDGSGNNTA